MRVALPTVTTYGDNNNGGKGHHNDRVRYSSMNQPGHDELPLRGRINFEDS